MFTYARLILWLPPVIAYSIVLFVDLDPGNPAVTATAAIALLMAVWWITEAVPMAVTALLPVVLFPLFGVMNGKAVSEAYINHIIFLFIGGFLVALAMERWSLHRRIALRILMLFGGSARQIILGFMLTTAFLSMWISNTATAMLMVPIVLAISKSLEEGASNPSQRKQVNRLTIGMLLSVAYSASIGGASTLIGTPPNLSFSRILTIMFPQAPEITFAQWMFFALPTTLFFLVIVWFLLCRLFARNVDELSFDRANFKKLYKHLGAISFEERVILVTFITMALLWVFRADIKLGLFTLSGWTNLLANPQYINDGTVAILMASLLFFIPSRKEPDKRLLDKEIFVRVPWHIVLLFGGGFALANGFLASGLSKYLALQLQSLNGVNPYLLVTVLALMVTFLTELTSNTATTEMLLPVLAAMAVAIEINPLFLMIPATLSASFAFMLPVATPPNAIIFGSERVHIADMVRTGIYLNFIGAAIVITSIYLWGELIFGIDLTVMPDWAHFAEQMPE